MKKKLKRNINNTSIEREKKKLRASPTKQLAPFIQAKR